jgi:motility quorum-sensing regulator / GCU-specific mRNA interferase toxin
MGVKWGAGGDEWKSGSRIMIWRTSKSTFADPKTLNRTFTAKQGADALGMDDDAVVAVIQGLSPRDFDKSLTSMAAHRVWQDLYRPRVKGRELYVKFTLDHQGALLLISFKAA